MKLPKQVSAPPPQHAEDEEQHQGLLDLCEVSQVSPTQGQGKGERTPPGSCRTSAPAVFRGVDQEELPGVSKARRLPAVITHGAERKLFVPVHINVFEVDPGDAQESGTTNRCDILGGQFQGSLAALICARHCANSTAMAQLA